MLKEENRRIKERKVASSAAKEGHAASFSIIEIRSEQSVAKEILETPRKVKHFIAQSRESTSACRGDKHFLALFRPM